MRTLAMGLVLIGCSQAVLDPSQVSPIEALPVPHGATLRFTVPIQGSAAWGPGQESQYLITGVALKKVDQWYEKQLPAGTSWQSWMLCHDTGGIFTHVDLGKFGFSRGWFKADGSQLAVATQQNKQGGVLILVVKFGPLAGGATFVGCKS